MCVRKRVCARDKNTLHIITIIIIHQLCVKAMLHNGRVPAIRILVELNNKQQHDPYDRRRLRTDFSFNTQAATTRAYRPCSPCVCVCLPKVELAPFVT